MLSKGLLSSNSPEWATPQLFFDELNNEFHFNLDPCCTHDNAKCEKHFTILEDGLNQSWEGYRVFCNPPYGREIWKWVKKAYDSHTLVVLLLPARTDTKWFHDYIYGKAEIRFIKGRLHFNDSNVPAPFPSMVVIFK